MSRQYEPSDSVSAATPQSGAGAVAFPTKNYLPAEVRGPVVELLNGALADTTILLTQAKFAHWNVKGGEFYALHQLFDETAEVLERHVDLLAERITALGGQALGTAGQSVSNCTLPAMPTTLVTGAEYVEVLSDHLAIHDANLSEAIQVVQGYDDVDTADLLNEISRDVSQYLWFHEAHLQTEPVPGAVPAGGGGTAGVQTTGSQVTGGAERGGPQQIGPAEM